MGIKEFIENRKSIREYKNKKFSSKDIKEIKNKIESINKEAEKYGVKIIDRKSTRLNSSHARISYAVFCLKKKTFSKK